MKLCSLFAIALILLPATRAAEQAVELFPGKGMDARRAARVAFELKLETTAPPAPAANGWLTKVALPPPVEITRLPNPAENGEYVFITPHYVITCPIRLNDDALQKVAAVFESTYAANAAIASRLPVLRMQVPPKVLLKMHVRLVPNLTEYLRHGGVRGSAGVYQSSRLVYPDNGVAPENQPCTEESLKKDTVLVAFPAVGLNEDGSLSEYPVNTHLLSHEGTHQCFIYNNLPIWSNEGWAEYVGASPHVDGFIDFEKGFALISARARRSAATGRMNCDFSLYDFFTMSKEKMYRLGLHSTVSTDTYALSAMTVAFFLHMDGERGVVAMRDYLQARVECKPHEDALRCLAAPYGGMQQLQDAFVCAWQSRSIDLKLQSHRQK